jgi:hypothetical protein
VVVILGWIVHDEGTEIYAQQNQPQYGYSIREKCKPLIIELWSRHTLYASIAFTEHAFSPATCHFAIFASLLRSVIRLKHPGLTLVSLRECITALLAHALDLANFADGLLELLHSIGIRSVDE